MGGLNPVHWIILLIVLATVWPIARLLQRTGRSGWWAVLYFVPLINWIGLWVWAFTPNGGSNAGGPGPVSFTFRDGDGA